MTQRILVVEDETSMARLLKQALEESGYEVTVAQNGREGLKMAAGHQVIVVDVMMPQLNGFEMVKSLREQGNRVPVLFLTAKDKPVDRVKGLDLGGDDYLGKPFDLDELLARVRSLFRRLVEREDVLKFEDLVMDVKSRKVERAGRPVFLSATEFGMLRLFMTYPTQTITKEEIFRELWSETSPRDPNLVQVYVNFLRKKLEAGGAKRLVFTVHGSGYVLESRDA